MITLENKKLSVNISNGRGARIESFLDKEKNKEWVWKPSNYNTERSQEILNLEAGFDEHWAGGWEEVFPNDAPCEVESFRLVDHGEVWRRNWQTEDVTEYEASYSLHCETYPVSIKKTFKVHPQEPVLEIHYQLHSHATKDLPFIFKFHPALAIEENDKFIMPEAQMEPIALGFSRLLGREEKSRFPIGMDSKGEECSLKTVRANDGHTREFVKLSDLPKGHASLVNSRTSRELKIEYPQEVLPYVWLFQSYGGFMDHYVAMMEPTNAGHYDLAQAHTQGNCGIIKPNEKINFTLKISLRDL